MTELPPQPADPLEPPSPERYSQRYAIPGVGAAWVKAGLGIIVPFLVVAPVVLGLVLSHRGNSNSNTTPAATADGSISAPPASLPPDSSATCSPAPCATAYGIVATITVVDRNLPNTIFLQPEAGHHGVALQLTFRDDAGKPATTPRPEEFRLRDATGTLHDYQGAFSTACGFWNSVELEAGQSQGPEPLCFQAGGPPAGLLTVIWNTSPSAPDLTIRLP